MTVTIHPDWHDYPLVAAAREEVPGDTGAFLSKLLDLMNEVEDRFPGLPFSEVLRNPYERNGNTARTVRGQLRKAGACEADIAIVCPSRYPQDIPEWAKP